MAWAAIAVTLVGTAVSAVGQIRQAKAQAASQRYNAQLALREQSIARDNARLTREQTRENERRQRIAARKRIGNLRANYGASGVNLQGSPLDVLEESAANAELDALTIRHEGLLQEISFLNQGYASGAESELLRSRASSTEKSGYVSAAGTLLSGGSQGYSIYQNNKLRQTA